MAGILIDSIKDKYIANSNVICKQKNLPELDGLTGFYYCNTATEDYNGVFIDRDLDFIDKNRKLRSIIIYKDEFLKKHRLMSSIKKIKLTKNINIFGQYYLDILKNVNTSCKDYNYAFKLDIKDAFPSVRMEKLYEILSKYVDKETLTEIKELYNLNIIIQKDDKYYVVKREELHVGLYISTRLFEIYIDEIFKNNQFDSKIISFVDDILLFNNDFNKIINDSIKLQNILFNYNLRINLKKIKFVDLRKENLIFMKRYVHIKDFKSLDKKYLEKENGLEFLDFKDIPE